MANSSVNGKDVNFEFSPFPVTGFKIDGDTNLQKAVLRGSVIVDKALCAQASFLSFLSARLDDKSSFSLMLMDQVVGLVDFHDPTWTAAVKAWKEDNQDKMNDPDICYIYVVSGFIQKNIIKKKFTQFDASGKGGAYGVNIQGKLSTSNEEYSLDIIFRLTPAIIKRPATMAGTKAVGVEFTPNRSELKLFASGTGAAITIPSA